MATNFYHTKTACLACIGGQFHQLIKVNKICRSPKTRGKIGRQKKNTIMEQLIFSNSGYINMFTIVCFEFGINAVQK